MTDRLRVRSAASRCHGPRQQPEPWRVTMKKMLLALLATSTLAIAAPALAHDDDDDWGRAPSYQVFQQQYRHIWQGIQHGLSDGSYTPGQADYFARQLRN